MLGWAALAPVSAPRLLQRRRRELGLRRLRRRAAAGSARALLEELVRRADALGVWTIQAGILAGNDASIALHERCGFRIVGARERIAKKRGDVARRRADGAPLELDPESVPSRSASSAAQRGSSCCLLVRVRLVVQVLAALAAEAGAVGPAEDLLRQPSATASRAHAETSRFAPSMYGVVSSSSSGDDAWYSRA